MAYVPNPTDVTQPVESVLAETAAAEFRALKAYVQTIVSTGGIGVATPGQICMFPGNTPLAGWLELDGTLKSRITFANLWAAAQALGNVVTEAAWASGSDSAFSSGDLATTFRLPDFRGIFLRGWDHGRGLDAARAVGTFQQQMFQDHVHGINAVALPGTGGTTGYVFNNAGTSAPLGGGVTLAAASGIPGTETRPINGAVMYCIKT